MAYDDMYGDDPFQKRRQALIHALAAAGGIAGGIRGGGFNRVFGGLGRSTHSAADMGAAALPQLSFNPFAAQQSRGVPNLAAPSQVSDNAPVGGAPSQGFYGQDQAAAGQAPGRFALGGASAAPPPPLAQAASDPFRAAAAPQLSPYSPDPTPITNPNIIRLLRGF